MKTLTATLIVVLVLSSAALAQSQKAPENGTETTEKKSVNGFGAFLIVVEDPQALFDEWQKPGTPNVKTVSEVKRDVLIGAFVIFGGCKPDARGVCNSEVTYTIYNPDGSVLGEKKDQPLWKEPAPPVQNSQLGKAVLALRLSDDAPAGDYLVKAKVSDLNAKISFEVQTKFRVN
jgi:hypothetical protein